MSEPMECAMCGNPQDEHGGPLYAHRYVAPQPAPAEPAAYFKSMREPVTGERLYVAITRREFLVNRVEALEQELAEARAVLAERSEPADDDTDYRFVVETFRAVGGPMPSEAAMRSAALKIAAALSYVREAKRSEPTQDFRISPDPREDEF